MKTGRELFDAWQFIESDRNLSMKLRMSEFDLGTVFPYNIKRIQ